MNSPHMTAPRRLLLAGLGLLVAAALGGCGSAHVTGSLPGTSKVPAPRGTAIVRTDAAPPPTYRARAPRPRFTFEAHTLAAGIRRRVTGSSWHKGCPVGLDRLRFIRMGYWGFDRKVHHGAMIVNATVVNDVRSAFGDLFAARFPIRRMHLVDDYGADDYTSIEADNTSSFNCRRATASTRWSEHAYGRAIDIDPIENPYVYANGSTTHRASRPYLDRSRRRRGMAAAGGTLVNALDAVGWGWGGRWTPAKDLQHFSSTGG